ncbi:MAG: hypothetical protein FWD28_01160 [Treponema sp.]|nr:hypothetical protein [Treponema sp.]
MFKEYDELIVKIPSWKAFETVRKMIKEKIQIVITIFGIEKEDHNTYGRVSGNKIIYYNRPMYTQGIKYKTTLTFNSYENNSCKIIVERTRILFFVILWLIVTVLSFAIFSINIFSTDSYTITINDISRVADGRPYNLYVFPFIMG